MGIWDRKPAETLRRTLWILAGKPRKGQCCREKKKSIESEEDYGSNAAERGEGLGGK